MSMAADKGLSIGEVSSRTGLSVDTLRFYEREGLLVGPIHRTVGGRRRYSEEEVGWLGICRRLRSSGMPLPQIRAYAELVRQGPGNEVARYKILQEHERVVRVKVEDLQEALAVIEQKVHAYAQALSSGTATELFLDASKDDKLFNAAHPHEQ